MGRLRLEILGRSALWDVRAVFDPAAPADAVPAGITRCRSSDELLALDLDAVFVCTPNHITAGAVIAALASGRHVFAEKPPGRDLADAQAILAEAEEHPRLKLKFGFNHRYHDSIREAKALVDGGRLGRILWMRGVYGKSGGPDFEKNWRSSRKLAGGGILIDQGIHMLDLMRLFLGDPDEVKSFVTSAYWDIDVEDNAFAILRTPSNQVATLHSSSTQWKHLFSLEIYMVDGYATVQGILTGSRSYGRETLIVGRRAPAGTNPDTREEIVHFDHDNSWQLEVDEFARCILEDTAITVGTPEDAVRVMDLVERIYGADPAWQQRAAARPAEESPPVAAPDPTAALDRSSRRVVVVDDLRAADIRPPGLFREYLRRSSEDARRFFDPSELVRVVCPGCATDRPEPAFEKDGFAYVLCADCGTLYASPRPTAADLARYYRDAPAARFWREEVLPITAPARRERIFRPRAQWVGDLAITSGLGGELACLDLATGYGRLLLDPIEELGIFARVASADATTPAASAHVVTAFEALERAFDPLAVFDAAARALVPDGLLAFTTLTISGLDLQVLWERARNIFPPDHVNLISIEGLERLATRAGFTIQELSTPGHLDLELLADELPNDPAIPRFLRYLFTRRDAAARRELQELLQKHRLSSHVRGVLRKRGGDPS